MQQMSALLLQREDFLVFGCCDQLPLLLQLGLVLLLLLRLLLPRKLWLLLLVLLQKPRSPLRHMLLRGGDK